MYTSYYGLHKNPFDLAPNPSAVFMSESHQEAISVLRYGVIDRKGFLLLTGDVGTGKTTLLQFFVASFGNRIRYCLISNPTLSVQDFYQTLAEELSLPSPGGSKARFLQEFKKLLADCQQRDERVILIIDEAHVLPLKLLEEVRLLANQDNGVGGVLSVFLVGQPELNQRLTDPQLLALRQRIATRYHLEPFDRDTTVAYISFRLRQAGASRFDLFTAPALSLIHKASRGVPRVINLICGQALLTGFADGRPVINVGTIRESIKDLRLPGAGRRLPLPRKSLLAPPAWLFTTRARAMLGAGLLLSLLLVGGILWQPEYLQQTKELLQAARALVRS
ncbi:ExeA family protein [Desulfurivibrio alkaliphilus]|uniref:AAA ATPase n=1 Tax=Desulfurivibrio alkaliphilus (strain DSM 19089 / UNIQEM U267 / AHT2) TaxID=589865 RepID=D6Z4F7_DESAT|nr:AAA family ATPase [Desulfurivibrio alkaliphilus]ADH86432.1 AAA ATPase [Desulfurivibrio alkaliphilus AHT 2]